MSRRPAAYHSFVSTRGMLLVKLPPDWFLTTIEPKAATPLPNLPAAVEATLIDPLQSKRLIDLARSARRVCIVFTDATRACPDRVLVPALLRELAAAGMRADQITLLCATGMHRPSTRDEKIAKLGRAVVDRYRVIDHDPFHCVGPRGVVRDTAQLPHDFDVQHDFAVNPLLVENDLIIATGVVEPHQYAGYSGGGKTAVIGCGSEATIAWTHGPHFLDQPGVRLGRVDGNPFQQFVRQAAEAVGLKFVVNVVLDGEGRPTAVRAGHPIAVQDALVAMARLGHEVQLTQLYDLIITKVDPPKDINLYQASRAATYLGLTATPSLRRGGVMIIEARCPEGPGQGVGEQRFFRSLSEASNLEGLLARFRAEGCLAGEQRAFMLAQVLLNYTVVIAGSECPEAVQACHMLAANSIDEAIALTRDLIGEKANVLHLSHPLHTVPVVVNNV